MKHLEELLAHFIYMRDAAIKAKIEAEAEGKDKSGILVHLYDAQVASWTMAVERTEHQIRLAKIEAEYA